MRWIETDTAANVNISSATAIGAYTATADALIIVDVCVDAVAGNGDYVMYVKKQINGAGSAYVVLPKTTMTAASGETAISWQSGIIAVKSGDILTVYVDGLAGDTTTPDYYTRWFQIDNGAASAGATAKTYTVTDASSGLPIADVNVWVTTDAAGSNVVASDETNNSGQVTFYLDSGTTYYIWRQKAGYNFTNPDQEVA